MAYIVNKTDGTVIATIADGTIDTSATSITLLGKGFNNYGEIVAESWVQTIENFSSVNEPPNALRGQLWYSTDTNDENLRVNVSATPGVPSWVNIQGAIISPTQPAQPADDFGVGSLWFDSVNEELSISQDGINFTPLSATTASGTPPANPNDGDLFYDLTTEELKVFNPTIHGTASPGFDVVGPRYSPTEPTVLRADGDLWFNSNTKQLFVFDASSSSYRLIGPNTVSGFTSGDTTVEGDTFGGIPVLKIVIDDEILGIWSRVDIDVTALPAPEQTELTGFEPIIHRGLNLNSNPGTGSEPSLFTGPATEAFFADLAERYAVDGPVEAGELVSIGGEVEITKTTVEKDFNIFGVVSTNPGLKLNSAAGLDKTHPYIALTGRVPCKVVGPVNKGDRLVSSNVPGVAKAIRNEDIMSYYPAVFGRALETNLDSEEKIIEVTIGVK